MYRRTLTDEQRAELRARTRQAGLAPRTRDRLERGRLSDARWRVPRSARHLGQHAQTGRAGSNAVLDGGCDARPTKPRGGVAPMRGRPGEQRRRVGRLPRALRALCVRQEQRDWAWAEVYLRGLLVADVPRKTVEALAVRLLGAGPGAVDRLDGAATGAQSHQGARVEEHA